MNVSHSHAKADMKDEASPVGLDVYTSDGQLIGRIAGYLEEAQADEAGMSSETVDTLDAKGQLTGPKRLLIDGHGYVAQVELAVPETEIALDFKGRRATLPMTLAELRTRPHRDPEADDKPPVNLGNQV